MKKQKQFSSGILLAVIGIVLFSAKAVLVKLAYQYDVTSEHLLLFRMLFSLPFYLFIVILNRPSNPEIIRNNDYMWVVFFGFIGYYLASYFDFLGLQYIKAGLERIILFVYPTLVILMIWLFFKQKITKSKALAILLTYCGVVIAFWGELSTESNHLFWGVFLIFMSALTYALYIVGSGWLIPKFGVITFTSYAMITSSICIIIQYLITDRGDIWSYHWEVYFYGFLMAIFCTLIPSYIVSAAIAKLGASNFAVVASIGPISTIILAFFLLDEKLSWLQLLGALVVILGILVVSRKNKET